MEKQTEIIELKHFRLIPISRKRLKIKLKNPDIQFSKRQAQQLERCYFSGNEKAWVFTDTKDNIFKMKSIDNHILSGSTKNFSHRDLVEPRNKTDDGKIAAMELRMKQSQTLSAYSPRTIEVYISQLKRFMADFPGMDIIEISKDEILQYMYQRIESGNMSPTVQNQMINAIKYYLEKIEGKPRTVYHLPRPRKKKTLPKTISKEEVMQIMAQITNLKHRCIVKLLYASGIRIGELLNIQVSDIQFDTCQIIIRNGKGGKDRVVMLATTLISELKHYLKKYKPTDYLFSGQFKAKYSAESY